MPKLHPTAIVEDGAVLGADVEVGPFCIVGAQVRLGDGVRLMSHVVVQGDTEIGARCVLHPFACLGGPPQHTAYKGEPVRLVVGSDNIIRENVTMHAGTPGAHGVTIVGSNCMFMANTHIAHDCVVGNNVILANGAQVGGHVEIADFVFLGGLVAVHQFTRLGPYSFAGGVSAVTKDVIPFGSVLGSPAHLEGLNLVGLRRRGFSRETINQLRAAYRLLFADEGTFQERVADVAETYAATPEVMEIVSFIRADANRPLCLPGVD